MSAVKSDGSIPYGSDVIAIGTFAAGTPPTITSSTNYVADSISFNRPAKVIERTNENDEPTGQVIVAGFVTGSATLQLATTSTAYPTQGQHFVHSISGSVEAFVIDSVDQPLTKEGESKVNITFRKVYNTAA